MDDNNVKEILKALSEGAKGKQIDIEDFKKKATDFLNNLNDFTNNLYYEALISKDFDEASIEDQIKLLRCAVCLLLMQSSGLKK